MTLSVLIAITSAGVSLVAVLITSSLVRQIGDGRRSVEHTGYVSALLPRELYERIATSEGMIARSPREIDQFVADAVWEKLERDT